MFYPKSLPRLRYDKVSLRIPVDIEQCYLDCHNVRSSRDGLTYIGRFDEVYTEQAAHSVVYADGNKIYYIADGGLYTQEGDVNACVLEGDFTSACFMRYGNETLFTVEGKGVYLIAVDGTLTQLSNRGYIDMASARDIVVLNGGNRVDIAPLDTTEHSWALADKALIAEGCRAVVSVGRKVYLLGPDCYEFMPRYRGTDATLVSIARNVGAVTPHSAVALGSRVLFAADGVLYSLHGGTVTRAFRQLDDAVDFSDAVACALDGYYLVSGKRRSGSREHNDITLLLDGGSGKIVGVFEWGADSLYSRCGQVYALRDGVVYRFEREEGESIFRYRTDMGTRKIKFLYSLAMRSKSNCYVIVESDAVRYGKHVNGGSGTRTIEVHGHGKEFGVEVQSDEGLELSYLELYARTPREV